MDLPGSQNGHDPQSDLAQRWVEAINKRDAEALVEIAAPDIALHPTRLLGERGPYLGHDGVRQWMADLVGAEFPVSEQVTGIRGGPDGEIVVLGHVLVGDRPVSPFSIVLSPRDGKIAEARAYLSDEDELKRLGRIVH